MRTKRDGSEAPSAIQRAVKALVIAEKAVSLYPQTSKIPLESCNAAAMALAQALAERAEIRLVASKQGLFFDGVRLFEGQAAYENFALALYNRHLAEVRFHVGCDARSLLTFLRLLQEPPEQIAATGGFENRLWELSVGAITVSEISVTMLDSTLAADAENAGDRLPQTRAEIDELLQAAYAGRSRDQLMVARFLGDRQAVSRYLVESSMSEDGASDLATAAERFAELAEIAYQADKGERHPALLWALAEAFGELDPSLGRQLLVDEVFPEARTNEALAAVIRMMDLDRICDMLVEGLDQDDVSKQGLVRAIRNLSLILMSSRGTVASAADQAMRRIGLGASVVSEVMEMIAPSRIAVQNAPPPVEGAEKPAEAIFRLMDFAPAGDQHGFVEDDPDFARLREEARRGVTDGDVMMALVSLVILDTREAPFASTMAILEDSLEVLIERGEVDVAADVADALIAAAENPALDSGQQRRLRNAIGRFTRPEDIRSIVRALKIYPANSKDHEAARHLLEVLGVHAVDPLVEQLASEDDMGMRKMYVDLLSDVALRHVERLGAHVGDPRWFVVRNVVGILGSTRSASILPYLERVVRHPEPRVRRETIRALSNLSDRRATDFLISALEDPDGQNVQLAARYLGARGVRAAIPALEAVARGEGRGNREPGPRVEAIEALGRMCAVESIRTLEALASKRSILGGTRGREVRAAAEEALQRIKTAQGGGA